MNTHNSDYQRRLPWTLAAPLLLILALVFASSALTGPAAVDSVRDIYQAQQIAEGDSFPLKGPALAHSVHTGPIWFYLLAIPASLSDSWAALALFAFLLGSLKFWLAFLLGRTLDGDWLGCAFAIALALPGWASLHTLNWTHTIILETSLLLFALSVVYATRSGLIKAWFLSGVCFSLALHAHPTALPFAALLVTALGTIRRRLIVLPVWAGGVAVLFIPYLIDQLMTGFPDLAGLARYGENQFSPGGPAELLKLTWAVIVTGPHFIYDAISDTAWMKTLHWVLVAALISSAVWRWNQAPSSIKRLLAMTAGLLLIVLVATVLMRGRTPWHMAYAPALVLCFIYALLARISWYSTRWPALLTGSFVLGLFAVTTIGLQIKLMDTSLKLKGLILYDVKSLKADPGPTGLVIPAFSADEHGEFLCSTPAVVLHGPYATAIDAHVGLEARMMCGEQSEILIGGAAPDDRFEHWAGISDPMQEALGRQPAFSIANIHFHSPSIVHSGSVAHSLAEGNTNPPRSVQRTPGGVSEVLSLQSGHLTALLLTNPIGGALGLNIRQVTCNDQPVEPTVGSNFSWLYLCNERSTAYNWSISYEASASGWLDVVLLDRESSVTK